MAKRKLSDYNIFVQKAKKIDPSLSFTEISKEWQKAKSECPTCYPNPGKKAKSKKSKISSVVVPDKSVVLPFVVGGGVGLGSGLITRYYYDPTIPFIPEPLNKLSTLLPAVCGGVGVLFIALTDQKALGLGLLLGGGSVLAYNLLAPSTARFRRRPRAVARAPLGRRPRAVARAPSPAVHRPLLVGRAGLNGSDQRPAKLGLPSQSVYSDLPIRPGGSLHAPKLGCDGNTRPSNLPIRATDRYDRKQMTPTYESGEVVLA